MNQSLSKIWIVIIVFVLLVGGILAWQYLMAPEEEAKVPEEKTPEKVELNYKNMLGQMFPEKEFSEVKEKYFKDRENRTYYVEEVLEGSFINLDEKNILLIVRRPRDELVHVEGFYRAFLTVFDIEGKEILTETMALGGDEGKIALYNCKEGTFVFFTGSVTYQGWMEGGVSLYKIKDRKFEEIWPEDEDEEIWVLDGIVEPKEDRLVVYEREKIEPDFVCPTQCLYISIYRPGSAMYSYAFVYSYDLYWNSNTCSFELIDETADWKIYKNRELGIKFKYPSEWESPIVKERSIGECNYKEVYLLGKGGIHMRPKTESAFLCFQPEPYFECGDCYFECSPPLSSFNCQPYEDETGNYDSMKIWNDLKSQGFNCSISGSRMYAPFIYNPELLQKQFQILEKTSQVVKLDKILEEEIKSDFILFRPSFMVGSDNRFYVELIYNSQIDAQGIKIIGCDGSDVSASNYYYRAVFLKDNKIISARFSLFSDELLEWADNEMLQIKQGKSFGERIIEALKDKNEESQIYQIVREYDLLVKSISLTF